MSCDTTPNRTNKINFLTKSAPKKSDHKPSNFLNENNSDDKYPQWEAMSRQMSAMGARNPTCLSIKPTVF